MLAVNGSLQLGPHEIVVYEQLSNPVSVKLSNTIDVTTIKTSNGLLKLTNERLILVSKPEINFHVPGKGDREFRHLTVPVWKCRSGHLKQPLFGPQGWECLIQDQVEGIEPVEAAWKLTLTFTNGGLFEYHKHITNLQGAIEQARSQNIPEVLPTYSES